MDTNSSQPLAARGWSFAISMAATVIVGIIAVTILINFQVLGNLVSIALSILGGGGVFGILGYLISHRGGSTFERGDQWLSRCWSAFKSDIRRPLTIISVILNLLLLLGILISLLWPGIMQFVSTCSNGICVNMIDDQTIGITDGSSPIKSDPRVDKLEQWIYKANSNILSANKPHITIVVVTTLSGDNQSIGKGYDDLQGAYVFQREASASSNCPLPDVGDKGCLQIRLLIANTGGDSAYAMKVAQQILRVKQTDNTFVGVMGWPDSTSNTIDAIRYLGEHNILMVSPSASSNALTAISPFFFRVAPLDSEQGPIAAQYAVSQLYAKTAAIFYSPDLPYSVTLAASFEEKFVQVQGEQSIVREPFLRGDSLKDSASRVQQIYSNFHALSKIDFIYCACYTDDLNLLLNDVRDLNDHNLLVMAGDAAYQPQNFTNGNYYNLYFTAFAFPDEWGISTPDPCTSNGYLNLPAAPYAKKFFCDYANDFDPQRQHLASPYGYDRADSDAILSYDATTVLAWGYAKALGKKGGVQKNVQVEDIQKVLLGSDAGSCSGFQGVGGAISFGLDGNPIRKAALLLSVDSGGHTSPAGDPAKSVDMQGQLQAVNPCNHS